MSKQAVNKIKDQIIQDGLVVENKVKKWFTWDRVIAYLIIIGLVIYLFNLDACRNRDFQAQKAQLDSVTLLKQKLVKDTNRLGQVIIKQNVIITDDQENFKKLVEEKFALQKKDQKNIKTIRALTQEITSTGVKDVNVPYEEDEEWVSSPDDTALAGIPCDSLSYVHVPKQVSINEEFFKLSASVNKEGIHIDSINFPDTQRIVTLEKKGGLFKRDITGKLKVFKKKELQIIVLHTNPYVKTEGMNSINYQPKVKGRWVERGLIIAATVLATLKFLK